MHGLLSDGKRGNEGRLRPQQGDPPQGAVRLGAGGGTRRAGGGRAGRGGVIGQPGCKTGAVVCTNLAAAEILLAFFQQIGYNKRAVCGRWVPCDAPV